MEKHIESLKWLLSSIGVTGVLVFIGFVIDLSFQDHLGFQSNALGSIP